MTTHLSSRPGPRRVIALAGTTVALGAATMLLPAPLAGLGGGRPADMSAATADAVVDFWTHGIAQLPDDLAALVDYWQRFHIVKAVLAAALLVVAVRLTIDLYRGGRRTPTAPDGSGRHLVRATPAAVVAALALTIVAANLQGVVAPLSTLIPLATYAGDPRISAISEQAYAQLTPPGGTVPSAPLSVLVDDFALYHKAFAVISAVLVVAFGGWAVGIAAAARRTPAGHRSRRYASAAALTVLAVATGVVCAANVSSALDSAHALALFFGG
ncbi:hypothetical protein ACPXB3_20345 [Gordonia sp. DT219]|uniref:hypothetical protein n=1 Tax=Gordonia sp. DT219 TaxID=3416658 RepID=UPI003CF1A6AB